MQPLQNKQKVTYSCEGQQILKLLRLHASKFSQRLVGASTAAEECERELEQDQATEAEQQMDQHIQHKSSVGRLESNWNSWEIALQTHDHHESFRCAAKGREVLFLLP